MEFSLKRYINNKCLNEKLQSDVLVHQLLNDKGGMFKYYKIPYNNTLYSKALTYANEMSKIIRSMVSTYRPNELRQHITIGDAVIDTDEKMIKVHDEYMKLYNNYIRAMKQVFLKPDPLLFGSMLAGKDYHNSYNKRTRDLYNITDVNFSIYTLLQIKKDKLLKADVKNMVENLLVFWLNKEGEILVVSRRNIMELYSVNNKSYKLSLETGKHLDQDISEEDIKNSVKEENLTVNRLQIPLVSYHGTLEWPTVQRLSAPGDKRELGGIDFIELKLDISKTNGNSGSNENLKIGAFTSKASNIYKCTLWGEDLNDYIIVYTPTLSLKDDNGRILSTYTSLYGNGAYYTDELTGFSDVKNSEDEVILKRKRDYENLRGRTFKWIKNILGKYKPYIGGKTNKYFEFGRKLTEWDYDYLYDGDQYCAKLAVANIKRYRILSETMKALKQTTLFKDAADKILNQMRILSVYGKQVNSKIKEAYKVDRTLFQTLTLLYGTFMITLNSSMVSFSSIYANMNKLQEYVDKKYSARDIKSVRNLLEKDLDRINNECEQITEIKEKLEEIINTFNAQ